MKTKPRAKAGASHDEDRNGRAPIWRGELVGHVDLGAPRSVAVLERLVANRAGAIGERRASVVGVYHRHRGAAWGCNGATVYGVPCAGHFDDDGDSECVCQQFVVYYFGQGGRQYRGYVDAAIVGPRIADWLFGRVVCARADRGHRHRDWRHGVYRHAVSEPDLGVRLCSDGVPFDGRSGDDRCDLRAKVRSNVSHHKFCDRALGVSVGDILFDRGLAACVANGGSRRGIG